MSCCGNKRVKLQEGAQTKHRLEENGIRSVRHQPTKETPIYFQYTGKTKLRVIGRVTHKLYKFDKPGAIVLIDKRDQRGLESILSITQVKRISS